MIVLLTGNKGSGKSEALQVFKELGWLTYNMDKVVHALYVSGQKGYEAVEEKIGAEFVDGVEVDRKKLGQWVAKSPKNLSQLNQAVQPLISQWIRAEIGKIGDKNAVFEMAAYFENESHYKNLFDYIVVIAREGVKNDYLYQLPSRTYESKADLLIKNNTNLQSFRRVLKTKLLSIKGSYPQAV